MSTTSRLLGVFLACALALVVGPRRSHAEDEKDLVWLRFDRYLDDEGVNRALERVHAAWPAWTRLESMGSSREGRPLLVLTVFDPGGPDPDTRPAFYVDGNTHGNEVQASEVCLCFIKYVLTSQREHVRRLLRRVTVHVAPCVNPDSRHRFFHTPQTPHSPRRVMRPVDDDGDGRVDEDGPDDLDGDGHIVSMRIKDPEGDSVVDERDDRLMRRLEPGETAATRYRMLGPEGFDNDGDGQSCEDGEGGVDPNRNWPGSWRPERDQDGAGPYPLSEPETRATALWMLRLPHLSGVQSFHNAGRMILRPPAAFTDREARMPGSDIRLYEELQRRGLGVLPTYRAMQIREDLYRVFGGFVDWTWFDLGVFSFTNELWGNLEAERGPADEARGEDDPRLSALRWNDEVLGGAGFVRWHEVKHPTLGTVEVGGWTRFTTRTDPVEYLHETCMRNALFCVQHAEALPDVHVEVLDRDPVRGTIDVRVRNDALLPTIGELPRRLGVLPPDRIRLEGGTVTAALRLRAGRDADVLDVRAGEARLPEGVEGAGEVRVRLFVTGEAKAIVFTSRTGGTHRVALQR